MIALLSGCGPSYNFVGHWIGYRGLATQPGADPSVAKTLKKVEMKIFDKGQFVLFDQGLPKQGTAHFSGQTASLQIDQILDRRVPEGYETAPIELKAISKDKIEYHDPAMGSEVLTLERQPS